MNYPTLGWPTTGRIAFAVLSSLLGSVVAQQPQLLQGPFVGHVEPTAVHIWARANVTGDYVLTAHDLKQPSDRFTATATAKTAHDFCMVFALHGLRADHHYRYDIQGPDHRSLCSGDGFVLHTSRAPTADGNTRLMFGSCCY